MKANRESPSPQSATRPLWKRVGKYLVRALLAAVAVYAAIVLVGLFPVNNNFVPAPDGIRVFFISNPVHADVVLPLETELIDWREHFPASCFAGNIEWATHVAIGWGERDFFLQTPTWADLRLSTAVKALLWPSGTSLHISMTQPQRMTEGARAVAISYSEYERLVEYILASFHRGADGRLVQIPDAAYGTADAFFEARGAYHLLNTCNSWVGEGMRTAGIRTPWLTPLPKTMFLYLPEPEETNGE